MSSKNQAKIYLWNANGIKSKIDEVVEFLYNYSPEILCINETKLNQDEELIFLKTNYNFLCKSRNSKGGGVAILVRKDIKYEETKQLDKFESEHLCIKTNYKNQDLYVITYYNPPSKIIEKNMLEEIEKNFQNYIICGDLNSRSKSFGCNGENQNGSILNEFIQNSNVILANNQDITYFRPHSDYKEILDIILVSKNFHRYCLDFEVKYECSLESDHYPVELKIQPFYKTTVADVTNTLSKPEEKKEAILNYSKANWDKFRSKLDEINIDHIMTSLNVDEINNFIIQNIITAANETIPFMKSKNTNPQLLTRLPKYLINMIKRRRYIKKKLIKVGNNINLKKEFYILSKNIKEDKKAIKNEKWSQFAEKFKNNLLSSRCLWNRIKKIKNGNSTIDFYPTLEYNNKKYEKDEEKVNLFGSILSETFTDTDFHKYNNAFKEKVEKEMSIFFNHYNENYDENVNRAERKVNKNVNLGNLNKFLKSIKATISSGEDGINNLQIKNINNKLKVVLVHLFRIVIKTANIPTRWKQVNVKMIPKKVDMKGRKDPKNYRPISLTNCLARLCERFVQLEINTFLKK